MPLPYANKLYPTPIDNQPGAGRDQQNLDFWSRRASRNSDGDQHRAKGSDGRLTLPDTGKAHLHDTAEKPAPDLSVEAAMISGTNYSDRFLDDDD